MERTRHFVATCYVVCDGATLLHEHDGLDVWLPPGGHVDRDELPHETALRETYEETGLRPDIVTDAGPYDTDQVTSLPRPAAFLLEDIDVHDDGRVAYQHVDFVYFAERPPNGRAGRPRRGRRRRLDVVHRCRPRGPRRRTGDGHPGPRPAGHRGAVLTAVTGRAKLCRALARFACEDAAPPRGLAHSVRSVVFR